MAQATPNPLKQVFSSRWNQLILGGLVLLLALTIWMLRPQAPVKPPLQTVAVVQGPIVKSVAATGKVVPNFEVEIKGKASGKIMELPYDVSDFVQQGALLVRLDPIDESRQVSQAAASLSGVESRMEQTRLNLQVARRDLSTSLARAKADLQAAEVKAKEAQAKEQRLNALISKHYISQEEYDMGTSEVAQSRSALENAKVRLDELKTQELGLKAQGKDLNIASADAQGQRVALATSQQRLTETRIFAPISGIVTTRPGQIGQIVASGISNVGGGTAIMTIADLSRIFVRASVDESDVGQVRIGQLVKITADAFPGEVFQGKVVQVAPKGLEEANVVTFDVKIELLGKNRTLLKPEMTANVEILIEHRDHALTIPSEALMTHQGKTFVKVAIGPTVDDQVDAEKTERRAVTTGINNGTLVEIVSGLKATDKVVLGANEKQSRWKKGQPAGGSGDGGRGQRMMMRSMGGGRR